MKALNGHTDSKGAKAYNQALSERRAESVRQWFIQNGLNPKTLQTQGLGETSPTASNKLKGKDNPEGRALNRRVELKTRTKQKVTELPKASRPRAVAPKPRKVPRVKRPGYTIPARYNKHGEIIKPSRHVEFD